MKQILTYMAALGLAATVLTSCSEGNTRSLEASQLEITDTKPEPMAEQELSKSIYDYTYTSIDGEKRSLSEYKGRKMLIVNTASECGYTPQYEQLEKVSKQFPDKLVVIGFPSNDFGAQEPGSNEEIKKFCEKNYGVTFPLSEKITVKGENQHPVYQWLTKKELNGVQDSEVKWNFQKYLINEEGKLISIYYSKQKPDDEEVIDTIEK